MNFKQAYSPENLKKLWKNKWSRAFIIGLLFAILLGAFTDGSQDKTNETNPETVAQEESVSSKNTRTEAWVCTQNYVEKQLKSPSSADFPWLDWEATEVEENKYVVTSYVDAQNAFGAEIRTHFVCQTEVIDASQFLCDVSCEFLSN